jgi:hypothetical protein
MSFYICNISNHVYLHRNMSNIYINILIASSYGSVSIAGLLAGAGPLTAKGTYIYLWMHIYICVYIRSIYIYMYVHIYTSMTTKGTYMYLWMHICMYVCI